MDRLMELDSDIRVHRAVSLHPTEKGRSIKRPFSWFGYPEAWKEYARRAGLPVLLGNEFALRDNVTCAPQGFPAFDYEF